MNAWIERMMNSENLGVKNVETGALDGKIWSLEAFNGKTVLLGDSRGYLWNFDWLESFGAKEQGLLWSLGISHGFFGVFGAV
jgi:hypothetical protein